MFRNRSRLHAGHPGARDDTCAMCLQLSARLYACLSARPRACACMCRPVRVHMHVPVGRSVWPWLPVCSVYVRSCVSITVCLNVCLSGCLSVYMCVCLDLSPLPACPSVSLFVCVDVRVSACRSLCMHMQPACMYACMIDAYVCPSELSVLFAWLCWCA